MARESPPEGLWRRLRGALPQGSALAPEVWAARHRGIVMLLWAHAAAVPVFALVRGYSPLHALVESLVLPAAAIAANRPLLSRRVRAAVSSVGLLSASAILVHLSGGLIELHFHFFVMVAVVALYQDWIPFLTAIGYVLVHHGLFGALDPTAVYNHPAAQRDPWRWAGVHALFVSAMSAAGLVTWRLNERLHESEVRARYAAEQARARLAVLANASEVISSTLDMDVLLRTLADVIVPDIADTCTVYLTDGERELKVVAASAIESIPSFSGLVDDYPAPTGPESPLIQTIREGRPLLIPEVDDDYLARVIDDPAHLEVVRSVAPTSAIVVPLVSRSRVFGVLVPGTVAGSRRRLTADDLDLVQELAHRASTAIENAQLFATQRTAAETLQHSLLPEHLPAIPGIESAARYLAGGPGVEVGGDWYDLLELPDGSLGLVMGDIVGRGVAAAALMGQIRNGLRALALDGHGPGEVLTRMNRMLHLAGPTNAMATVVFGAFDPETGTLRVANAGHPPPLILGIGTVPEFFETAVGMPLGAWPRAQYAETMTTLTPGATILLYTDGLVEDRRTPLEVGLARLKAAVARTSGEPDDVCDQALGVIADRTDATDDVALIAMRALPLGRHLTLRLPARPATLQPLRSTLRRWLVAVGATDDEAFDILVASGEACTNAIQHGRFGADDFLFEAAADRDVCIAVHSSGAWREPRRTEGGRGLQIMRDLMDAVDVSPFGDEVHVTMRKRVSMLQQIGRP